jgi:hypothetical protein
MWSLGPLSFIELFLRTVINLVRRIGTSGWPVTDAIISRSEERDFILGFGRVVVLHYKYRNTDERFEGVYREPFYYPNYARAYLNRFPGGITFPVRVNPKNTACSVPDNPKVVFIKVK